MQAHRLDILKAGKVTAWRKNKIKSVTGSKFRQWNTSLACEIRVPYLKA
jgi:hypothetical protein